MPYNPETANVEKRGELKPNEKKVDPKLQQALGKTALGGKK